MLWCHDHQISLVSKHVPGVLNVLTDALSRVKDSSHRVDPVTQGVVALVGVEVQTSVIPLS